MRQLTFTNQFKKDWKRIKKQGKELALIEELMRLLLNGEELDLKYKDHALIGAWKNRRDCHIQPDWLLIYQLTDEELICERTGSHSDIFN